MGRSADVSIEFLITSFIIVASPGTGALFTIAAGLTRGSRASVIAAFGCTLSFAAAFVALGACSIASPNPLEQNLGKIPIDWRSASAWVCRENYWYRTDYDGKSAVGRYSELPNGDEFTIDIKNGTLEYLIDGDIRLEVSMKIVLAQMEPGRIKNTNDDKIALIALEKYGLMYVVYIDFETGYYSKYSHGLPISATFFGKCYPKD